MKWRSTRSQGEPPVTLSQALSHGLAPDGGLYVPTTWPTVDTRLPPKEFADFATHLLAPFFVDDPLAHHLEKICAQAFNFPIPLKTLKPHVALAELFHGPTSAFKDFGARFLALCLEAIPQQTNLPRLVLVATSGDTGGAVASAFAECSKIPVVILFPAHKVSQRQQIQLTTWGPQVQAFAVKGTFDDCQRLAKEAFLSATWRQAHQLVSANSINIARLLPQMAYFAFLSSLHRAQSGHAATFVIPSGNLGNATAALWAQKLGFPIEHIVFAHNQNSTVPEYFQTGHWQPRASVATLANAMDVGQPSNFERVQALHGTRNELQRFASAFSVSDADIRREIAAGPAEWGEIWCPHTATAIHIGREQMRLHPERDLILVATAHPAKFEEIVEPLIGRTVEIPPKLASLMKRVPHVTSIEAQLQELWKALHSP